jgi:hypothetical protein
MPTPVWAREQRVDVRLAGPNWLARGENTRPVKADNVRYVLRQMGIAGGVPSAGCGVPMRPMSTQKRRDRLKAWAALNEDWLLLDQREGWFSRFAQPQMHSWAKPGAKLHLVERQPKPKD